MAEALDWVEPPSYQFKGYGLFAAAQVLEADRPFFGQITWEQDACTMSDNWAQCIAPSQLPTNTGTGTLAAAVTTPAPAGTLVTFTVAGFPATTAVQLAPGDGLPAPASVTTDGSGAATITYTYFNPGTFNASVSTADGLHVAWTQVVIDKTLMPKVIPGPQYGTARGFAVYNGITCNRVGLVNEVERAKRRLMWTEERQVEASLMSGQAGNFPYLAGWNAGQPGGVQVLGTPVTVAADALSLVDGLGWLEGELGMQLGPQGLIHASRYLAPSFAANWQTQLQGDNGVSRSTTVGTKVVFGSGYRPLGPDGKPPLAGTSWIYASGPIVIRRGPVMTQEVFGGSSATATNAVTVIAERQYVIEIDCPLLAVQVKIPAPPHLP